MYSETLLLHAKLRQFHHRLVLAESCTAGLVAAELGEIPGISEHFCGSLVVYRNDSKIRWLGIDPAWLDDPDIGPVSAPVTEALAEGALRRTPEATLAGAITGHLGPGAPEPSDGAVHCAIAVRDGGPTQSRSFRLAAPCPADDRDIPNRRARQAEAASCLIQTLIAYLDANMAADRAPRA